MLQPIRYLCVEIWISTGLPGTVQTYICEQSLPTGTKLDLPQTLQDVTTSLGQGLSVQAVMSDDSDYGISFWKETDSGPI